MKPALFLLIVLISCTLPGCIQHSLTPSISSSLQYQKQLSQLTHWNLQGKIAIRKPGSSKSASLKWSQNGKQFDIFISGPLGVGATRVTGSPKQVTITNNNGKYQIEKNLEQAIQKELGWSLPLTKLPQWITGSSNNIKNEFNSDHTLAYFSEQQWRISYHSYQIVDQWLLPKKILMSRENLQVTILIKNWELY